jgi:hypothetical protein
MRASTASRLSAKITRRVFRPEEDERLATLVGSFGGGSWDAISSYMPGRTARQCRDRWKFYLCPSVNRAPWTPAEDCLLFTKHQEIGGKWSVLCQYFENRSLNNVKNRWNSVVRKVRALRLNENSLQDFLHGANLITPVAISNGAPSSDEREIQQDDPLSIFQIARLLNPQKQD